MIRSIAKVGDTDEHCWQQCSLKIMRVATMVTTRKLVLHQTTLAKIHKLTLDPIAEESPVCDH